MTDATANYCARVHPPKWRVLGVPLETFTIGHAHLLCASTDWRPWESYELTDQLFATGLYICSRPWRQVRLNSRSATWFAIWLAIRGRLAKANLEEKGSVFAEYLLWQTTGPRLRPLADRSANRTSRIPGAPMLSRLRVFAQPFGGMDCQFAEAYWLWSTEQECEGTLRVLNDGEKSFDDYCDAQDERLQQGRN